MIRRLIILLLIVGCDYAPTDHTHNEHFSCIKKWGLEFNSVMHFCYSDYFSQLNEAGYDCDTLCLIHAMDMNQAMDICSESPYAVNTLPDTTWCECEEGIKW